MNLSDALQIGATVIFSLGGGGAIVFGLSGYLGKLWADRALEEEKHKYADILQLAKSELDKATNRYQVELDSLSLVHRLRTTEEFSHLGQLWRHMATLQNAFIGAAALGFMFVPADEEQRKKYKEKLRDDYETALRDARKFFLEEKLFIPLEISNCAESTLAPAITETNLYAAFANEYDPKIRHQFYAKELPKLRETFDDGMVQLEKLMREHIEGSRLALSKALTIPKADA